MLSIILIASLKPGLQITEQWIAQLYHLLTLNFLSFLGKHLIRAKITTYSEISSDKDTCSENDTHMSQTLTDLIDLSEENYA
jgi:hypothetical protein